MTNKHADDSGPFKEFLFGDWLSEQVEDICEQIKKTQPDTSEFKTHTRNACKEQLLAVRSLVDCFIDLIDPKDTKKA